MRTILILMDSLNRHMLPAYGNSWVKTPNIDRLAAEGVVFEKHFCGSMPCIPARRDMMTGRLSFLETGWGPLEPWDDLMPEILRKKVGTYSHMITDHCHYFNGGAGDRYHNIFDSWEYKRGQPWDPWHGVVDPRPQPPGARNYCYGKTYHHQHLANLEYRDAEDDETYSSVQCIEAACGFVNRNHADDNWHLHLELFDPHEPFDCPQTYLDEYDDTWTGPPYTCPDYAPVDTEKDTPETIEHLRKAYAATITMNDRKLGQLFDMMDKFDMWETTAVILTTDHGYLLGEHGCWAKNYMIGYDELIHLPLIVRHPDATPGRRKALTGAIDIMPTILDCHGVEEIPESVIGMSFVPLLTEDREHHDGLLFGYFGREVGMTDGRYTYHRMPALNSSCDYHFTDYNLAGPGTVNEAEFGKHLKNCKGISHFRVERQSRFPKGGDGRHLVYDSVTDPDQKNPISNSDLEGELVEHLKKLLKQADAPDRQFERLSLYNGETI
ncbi:MAG: sulfatase [Spirochaetales bacterium]|nr:sulfatase [Spirochaetales bacterium]